MQLYFSTHFKKRRAKLSKPLQNKLNARLRLFVQDYFHQLLNNHELAGEWAGCRSVNITGDYRAIFKEEGEVIIFLKIGTHSELYGK